MARVNPIMTFDESVLIDQFRIDGNLNDTATVPVDIPVYTPSGILFKRLTPNRFALSVCL